MAEQQVVRTERLLQSVLQVGVKLSAVGDRQEMLQTILREARGLTAAEAGSLYIFERDRLRFLATQNDKIDALEITKHLIGKEVPATCDSLAGFVAFSKEMTNVPDSYELAPGAPFRINRDFEAATGYRIESILAVPLKSPRGRCIGVLELYNCLSDAGSIVPFPDEVGGAIQSLASVAAVTILNDQFQEQSRRSHLETIIRLSVAAEYRDEDVRDHIRRISRVSSLVAGAMQLPVEQTQLIEYASPMHDIGKVGIPESILTKPGPLTVQERRLAEKHTSIGAEILAEAQNPLHRVAREIALSHHERWDGGGYPRKLQGDDIPIEGRIVALADVFDSLVSRRHYKEPYPIDVGAYIIRRQEGKGFDPHVLEAFFSVFDDIVVPYAVMPDSGGLQA